MHFFEPVYGATPIEDISELIPTHISTRDELNEWEAENILKASKKYLSRKRHRSINLEWIKNVHRDMFDGTWKWAGKFRKINCIVGVDHHKIREELKKLVDDINYWRNNDNSIGILKQSVRIHHRLVKIHPFVNGNGRHARLIADVYLFNNEHELPVWPERTLIERTDIRKKYIQALQAADKGDYDQLESFTRKLIK